MKRLYTAVALVFAIATTWAQVPFAQAMKSAEGKRMHLDGRYANGTELKTIGHSNASKVMRAADATALPTVDDLITAQPEGTLYQNTYRTCSAFYPDDYGNVKQKDADGYATDIVVSGDGKKIYVKNPFINLNTDTWLAGDLDAEGNVEFKFPQAIYYGTSSAGATLGYAWKMAQTSTSQGTAIAKDETSQSVKFKWQNNTLTQVNANEVIGLGNENGEWYGYGIYNSVFAEFTDVAVKPTDVSKAEEWRLSYTSAFDGETKKTNVKIVIDNNFVWVGGIYNSDFWMMGRISGDNVVFPAQYLGYADGVYNYMLPLELKQENNQTMAYSMDNLTFTYDAAAKKMSTDYVLGINVGKNQIQLWEGFMSPVIEKVAYAVETPAKPVIYYVMPYNSDKDQPNMGGMEYILSNLSTDGKELDESKLFYNIYLDDQLLTFDKATYRYIENDMTDLPYGYTDSYYSKMYQYYGYDLYTVSDKGVTYQDIYLHKDFKKVGVKALYIDGDTRLESQMAEYTVTAINNAAISEGADVKSISYSDLSGRKVSAPQHGIYLKTTTFGNGKTKTVKIVK